MNETEILLKCLKIKTEIASFITFSIRRVGCGDMPGADRRNLWGT